MSNNSVGNAKKSISFFSFKKLMLTSPFWSLIFWACVWELIGQMGWMTLLPPLSQIWFAFMELLEQASFWDAFAMTGEHSELGWVFQSLLEFQLGF